MPGNDPVMDAFPLPPTVFSGGSRRVPASAPFVWLALGWAVFSTNPGGWAMMAALFLLLVAGLQIVPVAGSLAAALLAPGLIAGLLHAVRRLSEEERLRLADLFVPLRTHPEPLLKLGLLSMCGWLLIGLLISAILGEDLSGGGSSQGVGARIAAFLLALVLKFLFGLPLGLALCFSPALAHLNGMAPAAALQASFSACMKNGAALLVLVLLSLGLGFFSVLSLGLGLLILLPVLAGALYAAHQDIFLA